MVSKSLIIHFVKHIIKLSSIYIFILKIYFTFQYANMLQTVMEQNSYRGKISHHHFFLPINSVEVIIVTLINYSV